MSPSFEHIWNASTEKWNDMATRRGYIHSRGYYRFRSTVRMLIWIPITTYVFLGLTWFYV